MLIMLTKKKYGWPSTACAWCTPAPPPAIGADTTALRQKSAIDIQTATRAEKFLKTIFLKPGGPKNFENDRSHRCDRFCQIFVQIGAILAIFRPFEIFRAF